MNDLPPLPSRLSIESRDPTSARRLSTGLTPSPSVDVERESSRSHAASALRRAFSHARGSTVDENPLSPRRGENAGLETAGRMLSPILSRAREVAWENQRETESDALSMSGKTPINDKGQLISHPDSHLRSTSGRAGHSSSKDFNFANLSKTIAVYLSYVIVNSWTSLSSSWHGKGCVHGPFGRSLHAL